MSDARADRRASSNLHQLVARAHARYLASTRALPTTPVGAPVPAPLAPHARQCRRAAGWPNSVSHTKEKGGRACALAPANGRALAFVDDKLKHVHSPLPPLAYIPVTIDPTCTMPLCLAMTFGNFGVFSGSFSQAIARCRYDCQFRIYILSIQFLELKYCGFDDMISLKLHFIIHLKYIHNRSTGLYGDMGTSFHQFSADYS